MKLETLKKNNLWKWIILLLIVGIVVFVVTFTVTKAKYQYSSTPIVSDTIKYNTKDASILAINIEQDDGTYSESDTFPTSGYVINEEQSTCFISQNGEKITQDVTLSYTDNTLSITGLKVNNTKCKLYFDIDKCGTACKTILANNSIDDSRSSGEFADVFTDDTAGTIFSGTDDYGTTYFFAGANPNNWVKFAGFYWRIIRINGDGSIRLIYNGTTTDQTGETTQLSSTYFNSRADDNAYVGYMYGSTGASTYSATHTNTNSSTIKGVLDSWYSSNLSSYASYIDTNAGFCGDRTSTTSSTSAPVSGSNSGGYGTTTTYYGAYYRNYTTSTPSFKCSQTNDLYTVSNSSYGNKALTYPIGLITADEVSYAGAYKTTENSSYWLYTGQMYFTISPSLYSDEDSSGSRVFLILESTPLCEYNYWDEGGFFDVFCDGTWKGTYRDATSTRPVINLKPSTVLNGLGTSTSPFVVTS